MDLLGPDTLVRKPPGQVVHGGLGVRKDQRLPPATVSGLHLLHLLHQQLKLAVFIHGADIGKPLLHIAGGLSNLTDSNPQVGGVQEVQRQLLNLPRERCGEHHRLAAILVRPGLWHAVTLDDLPDLWLEPHVKHAVGLIEHQVGHALQVGVTTLEEVDQPARGSNDHLDPLPQVAHLGRARGAAVATSVLDLGALPEAVGFFLDLDCQFTCGRQHQHDGPITAGEVRLRVDVHNGRQEERQRLARTRFGNADHVSSGKCDGPALDLDGRRLPETSTRNFLQHVLWK
mmetsp:Transcript_75836/g.209291  ORF Transcript_75836/g.209291 Transcript_75836/m.209291 type:complete len:286 (-) Transcript_75836:489-1346(-)